MMQASSSARASFWAAYTPPPPLLPFRLDVPGSLPRPVCTWPMSEACPVDCTALTCRRRVRGVEIREFRAAERGADGVWR